MSRSGGSVITLPVAGAMRDVSEAVTADLRAWGTLDGPAGRTRSSPVAQLAEHATVNRRVIGSSPIGGAKLLLSAVRSPAEDSGPTLYPQFSWRAPGRWACGPTVLDGVTPCARGGGADPHAAVDGRLDL